MESLRTLLATLPGLRKHRYLGLAIAALCAALGIVGTALIPNKYEASARAYVDTQSILKPLMVDMAVQPNVEQQLKMMARALLSKPNLRQVGLDAGLFEAVGATTDEAREEVITKLGVDVKFKPAGRSDFFSLTYRNPSPESALKVVDSLLKMFVDTTRGDQRRDNKQALVFLDGQLQDYEMRLIKAEQALKDFKVANIEVIPDLTGDFFAKAADAQKEYEISSLQLRQAQSSANAIRQQLVGVPTSSPSGAVGGIGAPASTASEKRLAGARKRLDELSTVYTDLHPDVQNSARIVRELEQRVAKERAALPANGVAPGRPVVANKLHQDLSIALANAEAQVASARARAGDARRRAERMRVSAKKVPKVEAEYSQLTRDYQVNKATYDKLLERRESALLSGNMDASSGAGDFRVVDPPSVSSSPVWPNRPLFLGLVMFGSIGAGLLSAFLAHQSAPSFYGTRELRERTKHPVLGEIGMAQGIGQRAGSTMSSMLFWLLSLLFVACFALLIGYSMFGHLIDPETVPPAVKPWLNPVVEPAREAAIDATSPILKRAVR